jgi:ABC-2 type transport system ATP-binding protein
MIEIANLVKRYGDVTAVNDISFTIGEGEVVGFLGPNGAGKSTTLKILTCYLPATRGSVKVAGLDVLTDSLAVRERLGYLPETVPVYPDMRVEEFLRFRARLKGVAGRDVKRMVESALDRCGCLEMRRRMIFALSKGYRQRVGIADAIVHDPPLLVLDEPTSGLDPNQRIEVRKLIAALGADKTVILSSHILAEVEAVAKRVIIIHRGKIVADGTPDELTRRTADQASVRVEVVGDCAKLREVLERLRGVRVIHAEQRGAIANAEVSFEKGEDRRAELAAAIVGAGLELRELHRPAANLEGLFRSLTIGEHAA